ncbi:MAG TPA: FAD-binding oxidoreductase [Acidimicrobiales bacterium]|nr:FAD-binding oxidoreductase [Acidimicrobiales bacterium]
MTPAGVTGGVPTPPIDWGRPPEAVSDLVEPAVRELEPSVLSELAATGAVVTAEIAARVEASRDWWPLAQRWALRGWAPARPAAVVAPATASEVAAVLAVAHAHHLPVTAAGGRSGVCGGAVPACGGIALDCCGLAGVVEVDEESLRVRVRAGTFGPDLERELQDRHGLTVGHWPQSIDLATVGGWVACRGAGQYSTRYGKVEDLVTGLEVVLADGRLVRTGALAGAGPRSATGPDLTQLFVGSEGTLGVLTEVGLRARPLPAHEERTAWSFPTFEEGLEALRLTLRAGATPAVVRLYDERESGRTFDLPEANVLIVLDEGDPSLVAASLGICAAACASCGGSELGREPVERWLEHRNEVAALASLTRAGIVVDTVEVAAPWRELGGLYRECMSELGALEGCLAASAHESHAYLDGACLYFTFAGRGPDPHDEAWAARFYGEAWRRVMAVTRRHGGSISHHHGIGVVRGRYLAEALGEGYFVLEQLKRALDPTGILNPGKLGLPSPFGPAPDFAAAVVP